MAEQHLDDADIGAGFEPIIYRGSDPLSPLPRRLASAAGTGSLNPGKLTVRQLVQRFLQCHFRTFTDEVVRAKSVIGYASSASSSAFASLRSGVSKPSVNQP
jgi:hypothetical protein